MILLVEDDADVREALRLVLEAKGYSVREAPNGAEALAVLEAKRPCLLVLDLVMPVMDGWQLVAEMKARGMTDVPICVVSAFADRGPPEAACRLQKPFEFRDLLAVVERYCSPPS